MPWNNWKWDGPRPTVEQLIPEESERDCNCCNAKNVPLKVYQFPNGSERYKASQEADKPPFKAICFLCANTLAGVRDDYPHARGATLDILKHINFVGNEIIKRLN